MHCSNYPTQNLSRFSNDMLESIVGAVQRQGRVPTHTHTHTHAQTQAQAHTHSLTGTFLRKWGCERIKGCGKGRNLSNVLYLTCQILHQPPPFSYTSLTPHHSYMQTCHEISIFAPSRFFKKFSPLSYSSLISFTPTEPDKICIIILPFLPSILSLGSFIFKLINSYSWEKAGGGRERVLPGCDTESGVQNP